ncbi:MAG: ATP synthase subunit I [Neisseria sp.]|nr:ATP synthase subunit I [Neisseria sp.]
MLKIIVLQIILAAVAVVGSAVFAGSQAAWSAFLGGVCYIAPSILTAVILNFSRSRPSLAGYAFMFGEGLRIVLALIMMVGVFVLYAHEIRFIPFLLGLLLSSHVFFIVFWKVKPYGK